jgi:hypothetical protein
MARTPASYKEIRNMAGPNLLAEYRRLVEAELVAKMLTAANQPIEFTSQDQSRLTLITTEMKLRLRKH